jgi:hypothetical protein
MAKAEQDIKNRSLLHSVFIHWVCRDDVIAVWLYDYFRRRTSDDRDLSWDLIAVIFVFFSSAAKTPLHFAVVSATGVVDRG